MGGFALLKKSEEVTKSLDLVKDSFTKRGFKKFKVCTFNDFEILYVAKIVIKELSFIEIGEDFILSQGTFVYKKEFGASALRTFYSDLVSNSVDHNAMLGHFNLVYLFSKQVFIVSDAYNSLPIYYNQSRSMVSSSFLAVSDYENHLTVNEDVIIENIITGCVLTNEETYFKEIGRLNSNSRIGNIQVIKLPYPLQNDNKTDIDNQTELYRQIASLETYFEECSKLIKNGVDIGLSGGFDSRLILSILDEYFPDCIKIHTHWKKKPDNEMKISGELAKVIGKELNLVPVRNISECSIDEKESIVQQSFNFYDGQVRVNHSLFSEYRSHNYRLALLGNAQLGVAGLGGEQYRNDLSFAYNRYSFDFFIKEYVFDSVAKFEFVTLEKERFFIDRIKKIIRSQIEFRSDRFLTYQEIRKYYNRTWVRSGPGLRNMAENQVSFFLSPFNDPFLSERALRIRELGYSIKFQSNLIKYFNPALAKVRSDYGVNFYDSNAPYRLKRLLMGYFMPKKSYRSQLLKFGRPKPATRTVHQLQDEFYKELVETFSRYIGDLKIDDLSLHSNFFNRICGIGFLFRTYKDKIK